MTETEESVDLESLFDEDIPCGYPECPRDVVWKLAMLCCGQVYYFCDPHKRNEEDIPRACQEKGQNARCTKCHADVPPEMFRWDKI